AADSVAAVAIVGLLCEMLEQPILRLPPGDDAQHLLRLLRQRHRRHHADQLGHRQSGHRLLHLVEHGTRQRGHLDATGDLERLVEALAEAGPGLVAILRGDGDVEPGRGGVEELVEGGEDGIACGHRATPRHDCARCQAPRPCAPCWGLATTRPWTERAAWATRSDVPCPLAARRASTAARWSAASWARRTSRSASPSTAATSGRS